jgi:hypothetical protein
MEFRELNVKICSGGKHVEKQIKSARIYFEEP